MVSLIAYTINYDLLIQCHVHVVLNTIKIRLFKWGYIWHFCHLINIVEELIRSRGNFCMMLSHPPRCLKGIPSSNKKHVGSLKYEGGMWGKNYNTLLS